ncbi:tRNA(Ile)-lysidine synthase [Cellulomonas marina]|uniref:tRNA(Ile)-lysidine synthase n=1 Tax=Cellulomonas marina TaxID=988821 RepID=A0A1I0WM99_9CELL|nr:tRNA(Ile)-lysidine synthase [Cellulomonas marina]SFA89905.1 tRNA(Ile)-lysidine synthase [Cellulomonas marina]
MVAAVRRAVRAATADVPAGATVLVACSGGPDSLALAAGAAFVGPRAGWRAGAVVVDHGLQQGSADVAAAAAAACQGLGLDPVEVAAVDARGPGGPEGAARAARYAALADAARRHGAAAVLLGHTRDDQAESVLLALARGSGPRSAAGMAARRGALRRPLLDLPRATTLAACDALGLVPWHDPTNAPGPAAPLRSRVRGEVLPLLEEVLGPGVAAALARGADLAREQADALDALAADLLVAAAAPAAPDGASSGPDATAPATAPTGGLDADVLAAAHAGVRRAALRVAALGAGCPAGALTRAHVLALDDLVVAWHGQGPVALPGRVVAARRCGRLFLDPSPPSGTGVPTGRGVVG